MLQSFAQIFRDNNEWNEKTVIGFLSFAVMVAIAAVDLITGMEGINLEIKDYIYQSFVYLTIGSFGIAGIEKFSPASKIKAENATISCTCPECGTSCE